MIQVQTSTTQVRTDLLSLISAQYPGKFQLNRAELANVINVSAGHIANKESFGSPLVPKCKIGDKSLYQISDIVDFLMSLRAPAPTKRGRKTKAEKMYQGGAQ